MLTPTVFESVWDESANDPPVTPTTSARVSQEVVLSAPSGSSTQEDSTWIKIAMEDMRMDFETKHRNTVLASMGVCALMLVYIESLRRQIFFMAVDARRRP